MINFISQSMMNNQSKNASINLFRTPSIVVKGAGVRGQSILPLVLLVLFFLLWFLASEYDLLSAKFLPSPLNVSKATLSIILDNSLVVHIYKSVERVFCGFILAALVGIPLGFMLGAYPKIEAVFGVPLQLLKPISPIAWIPLAILWFGIGDSPAIFILFMACIFPILIAARSAVRQIDPIYLKVAANFESTRSQLFWKVIFPASLPNLITGLRIAFNTGWIIIVAAEMVGMQSGLGFMILDARNFLRTDLIIAGMLVIGVIGLCFDKLFNRIELQVKRHWGQSEI